MFITYYTDFPNMIANPPLGYIIKYCALSPFWLKVINSLVVWSAGWFFFLPSSSALWCSLYGFYIFWHYFGYEIVIGYNILRKMPHTWHEWIYFPPTIFSTTIILYKRIGIMFCVLWCCEHIFAFVPIVCVWKLSEFIWFVYFSEYIRCRCIYETHCCVVKLYLLYFKSIHPVWLDV